MTTITLSYRDINRKITLMGFLKINWKMVYLLSISLSLLLLVFYIFFVNELTKGTYLIKNYNKEMNNLLQENKTLEANFAESSFLGGVQDKVKKLGFEKTTEIKYKEILDNSLAKAK